jgi:alpha-galactosidase
MALCVKALYDTFPKIKAFGCCHEVFGAQSFIMWTLKEICGIEVADRSDIKTNVVGVNHFTWITNATYRNVDIFPIYKEYAEKALKSGEELERINDRFEFKQMVKMDLFLRYGAIAAAGDRHLAEFCPSSWYLDNPEQVKNWGFALTPVSWRWGDLKERLEKSRRLRTGEEDVKIVDTGEEGAYLIRALLGLGDIISNVNLPNVGQIPNLPLGAVVETNASFRDDSVVPVVAGNVPEGVYSLVASSVDEQLMVSRAAKERDLDLAFKAFCKDNLVKLDTKTARKLFDEMVENTKDYLTEYFK